VGGLRALLEGPPSRTTVELRHLAAAPALGIREVVDTDELADWWVGAMAEIGAALAAAGAAPAGPNGGLFPGELFELDRAEVTAFVPLEAGAAVGGSAVSAPGGRVERAGRVGRVERLEIPAVDVAVAVHAGSIADLDRTYAALGAVVAERAIGLDGPMREYYLVSPLDTDDESRHRTEVCWPVFPAGGQVEVGSASP
ncbi:MAG TPA: GyrI-like domain-containing protein, partial [Acidimicrobiales bacterium]|nr:GyrI-like domain-containing protein [Acidimicrobiales bacterium]